MVCLGNICRSPLAEGILKEKALKAGLNWDIDSAGTQGWHSGNGPDDRSVKIAKENGIDISSQRSRQFSAKDFDDFDLILAMDASNYQNILKLSNDDNDHKKVKLILNYTYPNENRQVPDPYYNNGFNIVYEMLDKSCDKIVELYS